jgi:PAS domain S-box-containing protein
MTDRIQLKVGKPSPVLNPLLQVDVVSQYAPVRQFANHALTKMAELAAKTMNAPVAAVCWVSGGSVRLMATHGLGADRLARSLPKDFTWFAPERTIFSYETNVIAPIQAFLGLDDYGFVVSVPLRSHTGHVMGSLLILDRKPRQLEPMPLEVLAGIADLTMDNINTALQLEKNQSIEDTSHIPLDVSIGEAILQAKESVIVYDLQGTILTWNAGAFEMYGYQQEHMLGRNITTIIPNDEQKTFLRQMQDIPRKTPAPRLVTRVHQSGFRIQVRQSLQAIRNTVGEVTAILEFSGLSVDVARVATIERFQSLVQNLPMLFVQTDAFGMLTFIEGNLLKEYKRSQDELLGLSVYQVFADQPEIQQAIKTALQGNSVHKVVAWREKQYEFWLVPVLSYGKVSSCQVLAVDITEQVQTAQQLDQTKNERSHSERSLLEASRRIEQLLETLPILAIAIDAKGCLTLLEGKGIKHFGGEANAKYLLGKPLAQVLPNEPIIENLVESALAGDEFNVSFEFRGLNVEVFVRPVIENKNFIGANAIVLDISDISKVAQEKRSAMQDLLSVKTELAQQQAFAQMVLETIDQGVSVNNTAGTFEYVSPVYAQMFGYEPQELIGLSPSELIVGQQAELQEALQERNEGWRTVNQYQAIRKDGSHFPIEVTGYPRRNRFGAVIGGGIALIRDISLEVEHTTEIAQFKQKLEAEREFATQVTSTINQGMVTIDAKGLVKYANLALVKMTKRTVLELIGIEAMSLAPESDHPTIQLEWQHILKGKTRTYRHGMVQKDGEIRQVEVTVHPTFNDQNRFTGSILLATDITELLALEASVKQKESYAISITESLQSGIAITDNQINWEYVNPAFTKLFGYTLEDLQNKNPSDLIHPDDHQALRDIIAEKSSGQPYSYRLRYIHKDGRIMQGEGTSIPRFDSNGKQTGTIATVNDITEQLALEQAAVKVRRSFERESRSVLLIANAISDGLLFVGSEGIVEYANPGALQLIGATSNQEMIGKAVFTWVIPEDIEKLSQEVIRIRQGEHRTYRFRIKRSDGEIITIQGTSYPRLEQQQYKGSIIVLRDISSEEKEQKMREEHTQALLESELKIRVLFEQSREQTKRLELIDTIRNAASPAMTTSQLIKDIVESISQTLNVPLVSIFLVEQDKLVLQHAVGYKQTIKSHPLSGNGVMVRSVKNRQIMRIDDASTDKDFVHLSGKIKSELCVPIVNQAQAQILGVINLESTELAAFNETDANLLLQIAERISDKIQMTHLFDELRLLEQQQPNN